LLEATCERLHQLNVALQQQQREQEQHAGDGGNKRRHSSRFSPSPASHHASAATAAGAGASGGTGSIPETGSGTLPDIQTHASAHQAAGAVALSADTHTQSLQLSQLAVALALEASSKLQQGTAAAGSTTLRTAEDQAAGNPMPAHLNSSCVDKGACLQAALALLRLAKLSRQNMPAPVHSAADNQTQQQQQQVQQQHTQLSAGCVSAAAELLQRWQQLQAGPLNAPQQRLSASSSNSSSSLHATLSAAALEMQQLLLTSPQRPSSTNCRSGGASRSSSSSSGGGTGGEAPRRRSQGSCVAVAASGAALAGVANRDVLRVLQSLQGTIHWAAACKVVGREPLVGLLLVTCCMVSSPCTPSRGLGVE
jgi:hypothetical protein